jgi:murein DD-endopeptidase
MISQTARIIRRLISTLVIAAMVGCASQAPSSTSSSSNPAKSADQAVSVALQQLGVPYRYGGSTPSGFDCSGLVYYSYARAGRNLPRTTAALWSNMQPVSKGKVQVGDILFFRISGKMSHVGMYIGNDQFVHAPSSGKVVTIASLRSDYYSDALIRAGRPN